MKCKQLTHYKDMFIHIRHYCAFQENSKNVFCECLLCTSTLDISHTEGTMVMQISAASPSPNFHSGKSYAKKICVYNFEKKMRKLRNCL